MLQTEEAEARHCSMQRVAMDPDRILSSNKYPVFEGENGIESIFLNPYPKLRWSRDFLLVRWPQSLAWAVTAVTIGQWPLEVDKHHYALKSL